jgi:hypothetical protein
MELKRLRPEVKRKVSREFLLEESKSLDDGVDDFIQDIDDNVELNELNAIIDEIKADTDRYSSKIDAVAAQKIHRNLPISRRMAADMGIWYYLSLKFRPDFIRHRWKPASEREMRKRFLGTGTWDENTFYRLWWAAELTYEEESNYKYTRRVFDSQTLARSLFDRQFSHYRTAARAYIDVLWEENQEIIEETGKRFNHAITTKLLEDMSYSELKSLIMEIKKQVKKEIAD